MTSLLPDADSNYSHSRRPGAAWLINGRRYAHTAARFWMALFDEVLDRFPAYTAVELSAISALTLDHDLLNPAASLERMLQAPPPADALAAMVQELDWAGPPASIRVTVRQGTDVCLEGHLSTEVADAETFMYLTAWLLEWAQITAFQWTAERVEGNFSAEDECHRQIHSAAFTLQADRLEEDMLQYKLRIQDRARRA